MENGIKLI